MRRELPFWAKLFIVTLIFCFVAGGWIMLLYKDQPVIPVSPNRGDYVRLHILGNSDSVQDQQLKLKVRDAVIAYLTPYVKDVSSVQEAREIISCHQEEIVVVANKTLAQNGINYPVAVQMGTFEFPVRSYGSLELPAGEYQAVRILLGQAVGQNWWCVIFPPLCFIDGTSTALAPITSREGVAQKKAAKTEPGIRWKIVDLWNKKIF